MKLQWMVVLFMITVGFIQNSQAQIIYSTDAEYKADISVYVADAEYKADLVVYKTDAEYKAKGNEGNDCL